MVHTFNNLCSIKANKSNKNVIFDTNALLTGSLSYAKIDTLLFMMNQR